MSETSDSRSDSLDAIAQVALAPLDELRALLLRRFGRALAPLFADRGTRIVWIGAASLLTAFGLTCAAPILVLAWTPIVLGVPHLIADIRYLVVRRGLHRRGAVVALTLVPLTLAMVVPTFELTGVAMLGAAVAAQASWARKATLGIVGIGVGIAGLALDRDADVALAHVHNLVAVVLWWSLRPSRAPRELVVPALAILGVVLLALGWTGPTTMDSAALVRGASVLPLHPLLVTYAPSRDMPHALRWVLIFAFAQSVHYAAWLRLIPEDVRARRAPRSFQSSYRALRSDLGATTLMIGVVLLLGLVVWASTNLEGARVGYLRLALFHGPLEFALIGLALAEDRRV